MNLELIKELADLKSKNLSYTEIAEITGVARTSIVLSLRLNKIFENLYSPKITSLNSKVDLLNFIIAELKQENANKNKEIKNLNAFINVDDKVSLIISKDKFQNLNRELHRLENEVDSLKSQLFYEKNFLNNLSLGDKIKYCFNRRNK